MKKFGLIAVLLGCLAFTSGCGAQQVQSNEVVVEETTPVEVLQLGLSEIANQYMYTGSVKPINEVNVLSTVNGTVKSVKYKVGDKVKSGDTLFAMDTTDIENSMNVTKAQLTSIEAQIKQAQTSLDLANGSSMQTQIVSAKNSVDQAKAGVTQAQNGVQQAKNSVEQAKSGVEQAKVGVEKSKNDIESAKMGIENAQLSIETAQLNYDTAKNDFDTYTALYEAGVIAKAELDGYETRFKNAELTLSNAQLGITSAKATLTNAEIGLKNAEENYKTAQVSLANAEVALSNAQASYDTAQASYQTAQTSYNIIANQAPSENTRRAKDALDAAKASKASIDAQLATYQKTLQDAIIKAPISGTIAQCNVKENTVLAQGGAAPFVIIDLSSVNIEVHVAEQLMPSLRVNDEVEVKVATLGQDMLKGKITEINPVANQDGTYTVKIKVDNKDDKLKSGMFAEVYFTKNKSVDTVVVPREAVLTKDDQHYVFIFDNGLAVRRDVELGVDTGELIEIVSGIDAGDHVVTKGQTYLTDGEKIRIVASTSQLPEDELAEEEGLLLDDASFEDVANAKTSNETEA